MLKFDPRLLRSRPPIPEDMEAGPCAMGPADGDELISMHVWVFQQQDGGKLAVASGDSRQPQADALKAEDRWMVVTGLDPRSDPFDPEKPAVAMAMALVKDGAGRDVKHWMQAVAVSDEVVPEGTAGYGGYPHG